MNGVVRVELDFLITELMSTMKSGRASVITNELVQKTDERICKIQYLK